MSTQSTKFSQSKIVFRELPNYIWTQEVNSIRLVCFWFGLGVRIGDRSHSQTLDDSNSFDRVDCFLLVKILPFVTCMALFLVCVLIPFIPFYCSNKILPPSSVCLSISHVSVYFLCSNQFSSYSLLFKLIYYK
jgi:hypothetical protein